MKFIKFISVSLLSLAALLGGAALQGLHFNAFLQPTAFLGVLGFTFAFLLTRYTPKEIAQYLHLALSNESSSTGKLESARMAFHFLGTCFLISGCSEPTARLVDYPFHTQERTAFCSRYTQSENQ